MDKIKTCPHCGGSASLLSNYNTARNTYYVFVRCDVCGAQGRLYYSKEDPRTADGEVYPCRGAVSAWNMRQKEKNAEEQPDEPQNTP